MRTYIIRTVCKRPQCDIHNKRCQVFQSLSGNELEQVLTGLGQSSGGIPNYEMRTEILKIVEGLKEESDRGSTHDTVGISVTSTTDGSCNVKEEDYENVSDIEEPDEGSGFSSPTHSMSDELLVVTEQQVCSVSYVSVLLNGKTEIFDLRDSERVKILQSLKGILPKTCFDTHDGEIPGSVNKDPVVRSLSFSRKEIFKKTITINVVKRRKAGRKLQMASNVVGIDSSEPYKEESSVVSSVYTINHAITCQKKIKLNHRCDDYIADVNNTHGEDVLKVVSGGT